MALLEADTDGVFFAAPVGWSEAQERALVADVAAELPPGLRLEYEGRYQAMLCHEVKNYALLTYDGELIMRGGALRSSRAETFGVRFLEAAVGCTLRGDVVGLGAIYQATVAALREHQLPLSAVATRARLTKTPAEYQAMRGQRHEAPYEALLSARRADWDVGEEVRYYRAGGGRYVWLPGDTTAPPEERDAGEEPEEGSAAGAAAGTAAGQRDYDRAHYLRVLQTSYVARLRKAFRPDDFAQLFRADGQGGLFDRPISQIEPVWIQAAEPSGTESAPAQEGSAAASRPGPT
jgi:DNA polymerase elongation subunit (family B)